VKWNSKTNLASFLNQSHAIRIQIIDHVLIKNMKVRQVSEIFKTNPNSIRYALKRVKQDSDWVN